MLSGYLPFQGVNMEEVFDKIRKLRFHFIRTEFEIVSEECKDLIRKLLVADPKKRLTGSEALQHPWFKKYAASCT